MSFWKLCFFHRFLTFGECFGCCRALSEEDRNTDGALVIPDARYWESRDSRFACKLSARASPFVFCFSTLKRWIAPLVASALNLRVRWVVLTLLGDPRSADSGTAYIFKVFWMASTVFRLFFVVLRMFAKHSRRDARVVTTYNKYPGVPCELRATAQERYSKQTVCRRLDLAGLLDSRHNRGLRRDPRDYIYEYVTTPMITFVTHYVMY